MAIKIYAIVENGIVVNMTAAEPSFAKENSNWVDIASSKADGVAIGWSYSDGVFAPPPRNLDEEWAEVRTQRDKLLSESDWVVIKAKECGTNLPAAWKDYRQALRNITTDFSSPEQVVFPEPPTV